MFEMIHPQYEFILIDTPLKDFYTPIYPSTEGLSQKLLLKCLPSVPLHHQIMKQNVKSGLTRIFVSPSHC